MIPYQYITFMYTIKFLQTFVKEANNYVILVKTAKQSKRTTVCQEWTSSPTFQSIVIDDISKVICQVCQATINKKLKLLGSFQIYDSQIGEQIQKQISKVIDKEVKVFGKCVVLIQKNVALPQQFSQYIAEDYQLKQQLPERQENELRIIIHGGLGFYLKSRFHINVNWGSQSRQSKEVRDKINPLWAQSIILKGDIDYKISIQVCDERKNILQSICFVPNILQTLNPYHFKIYFKEQFFGSTPIVLLSLIRQDRPRFTISERPVSFVLKSLCYDLNYLILSKTATLPTFLDIDMKSPTPFHAINKNISQPIELTPIQENNIFSVAKSLLSHELECAIINITQTQQLLEQSLCLLKQKQRFFQSILRNIYFQESTHTIKDFVEIRNPNTIQQSTGTLMDKWKVFSHHFTLRIALATQTQESIENLKQRIKEKGQQLRQLKKIYRQVENINKELKERKEVTPKQKISQYSIEDVIEQLFIRQKELRQVRKYNNSLYSQIHSIHEVTANTKLIDDQVIQNSKLIHHQQKEIQKMLQIRKKLPQQRQVLQKLQKIFEKKLLDQHMNILLKEQQQKLENKRLQKTKLLQTMYSTVHSMHQKGSLLQRIQDAQRTLASLNKKISHSVI